MGIRAAAAYPHLVSDSGSTSPRDRHSKWEPAMSMTLDATAEVMRPSMRETVKRHSLAHS
jgi:hypothetical protein